MDNPLVSIITPVFNGIRYLEACIQSVLTQTYPYIEHVFVDGGSSDGSLGMLTSYIAEYPSRIRFISEPDKGAYDAWNKGLRIAKGRILGWLGSDDMYEPDAIMTIVEFFRANPDARFVFGECNLIDRNGKVISRRRRKDFNLEEAINDTCPIPCPSAFYKQEVIETVGYMDTSLHICCDLDYWIRVGKVFQIHRIEKPLSSFRMHKDSVSASKGEAKRRTRECFIISRRHGGHKFSPRGRRYLIYRCPIIGWALPILFRTYHFIKYKEKWE